MKDVANAIADAIIENEMPKLDKVMRYVATQAQKDIVEETYKALDAYYQEYSKENGRQYIRTDEIKNSHAKKGHKIEKTKTGGTKLRGANGNYIRKPKRYDDVSLYGAMMDGPFLGAIGVCEPLNGIYGYQAGVLFNEEFFGNYMQHSVMGPNFSEWYIVENFLEGKHGGGADDSSAAMISPNPAGDMLNSYIDNYYKTFKKNYEYAYKNREKGVI